MFNRFPELPIEPPEEKDPLHPHCPVCGEECEIVYIDQYEVCVGCDVCMRSSDAWGVPECFPEEDDFPCLA